MFCSCSSMAISRSSGSSSSTGMAYWPVSQRLRSISAQRFEQKGRYFSDLSFEHSGQLMVLSVDFVM